MSTAAVWSPVTCGVAKECQGECRRLTSGRAGDEALGGRLAVGEAAQPFTVAAPLRAFQGRRLLSRIISLQYRGRDRRIYTQASFRAPRSFAIAARSGSDAMILRSVRQTPLRRHSLILAIASPRTKLPNSGRKRPSRRMTRVQKRFLTIAIFAHRGRRATFERGDTRSAGGFGRNEPDAAFTSLASYRNAFALDMLKESPLLWPIDIPEAEIVFVCGCAHLKPHTTTYSVKRPSCL